MTDTATVSKKDQHLANCAAMKVAGEARRAEKKAERAKAHRAFLDDLIAEGQARKASRIQAHVERNAQAKKPVASNDDQAEVEQAA